MGKIRIDIRNISYPMPCSLLGTMVGDKVNFLTVAYFSMVSFKQPFIMAALAKSHFTTPGIKESGAFSINIPDTSMAEATDYCGMVSGRKFDKSNVFEVFYGEETRAPMIVECPYNIECKLVQTIELPADDVFIGEIIAAYTDNRYLTNGVPDMAKMDPFILSLPEMKYMKLGSPVGRAWGMGKSRIN
jgi:flavin reductase (DIM6/NTAB) family NADH-FMN oxidoreductase RutF